MMFFNKINAQCLIYVRKNSSESYGRVQFKNQELSNLSDDQLNSYVLVQTSNYPFYRKSWGNF